MQVRWWWKRKEGEKMPTRVNDDGSCSRLANVRQKNLHRSYRTRGPEALALGETKRYLA